MEDYWKERATKYEQLNWVNNEELLKELLDFCDLSSTDTVIDAGCGTGALIKPLLEKVNKIIAFDNSEDMLNKIKKLFNNKLDVFKWNLENDKLITEEKSDKIISRMVFHHLTDVNKALQNCHKMLKPNGWMIIEEGGILPEENEEVRDWFSNMMLHKEERTNFTEYQLVLHLDRNKFGNITSREIINSSFSVNDWLKNSGQSKDIQDTIYNIHLNAPNNVKEAYKMKIEGDEITIQTKVLFIKGQKCS